MRPLAAVRAAFWTVQGPVVDRARAVLQRAQTRLLDRPPGVGGPLLDPAAQQVLDRVGRLRLRQPDRHTCTSSSLTVLRMLRMLRDPAYAAAVLDAPDPQAAFAAEARGVLRRTNSWRDARGLPQLPWPLGWGSRPAALVRLLHAPAGYGDPRRRYRDRVVDPGDPGPLHDAVRACVEAGEPVLLFVGDRRWFKHTVLAVRAEGGAVVVYEPARGRLVPLERAETVEHELDAGGWSQLWNVLLPTR